MKVNLRAVDLNLLTLFDALISEGQLRRAAEKLGMTQPAASSALARLRLTYGDDLFVRSRQGMIPTPRAKSLAGPIREALQMIKGTLDEDQDFSPHTAKRTFKLSISGYTAIGDYAELVLLPGLLRRMDRYSDTLSIETAGDLMSAGQHTVSHSLVDFSLGYTIPDNPKLDSCLLSEDEIVVIARRGHPRLKQQINRKTYLAEKHIVMGTGKQQQTMLELIYREQKIHRRVAAVVRQYLAIPALVAQTDHIASIPRRMAQSMLNANALQIYPLPFAVEPVRTYLVWHKALGQDKGHQWLKQQILEVAASVST